MGCKFTKVRNPTSRDEDEKMSEIISKSSSSTDSKKDLECHISQATRDIVEKCQQALSAATMTDDDVISLSMYPPTFMDEYSDVQSMDVESEMDIPYYREDSSDLKQEEVRRESLSATVKDRASFTLSSKLSNFFRRGMRSKLNSQDELSRDIDTVTGYGYEGDVSSSGWERSPTPTRQDMKKKLLQRTNSRLSDLSQMVATKRGIREYEALTLIHDILETSETSDLEIEDDGRSSSSSSSSSDDSFCPPQRNFRVLARPNAARGTRTFGNATQDLADMSNRIVEFEAEVENLIDKHAVATRDYRNRQLRPRGERGPRLPSFSLQFQEANTGSVSFMDNESRYSKHFANAVTRPQLTVQGLSSTDDRLVQWMVSQQRRDSERQ
ncbi:uncharacterized protein [Argopecten irradians]|uniref:uncharacterized protein n=1 Tax=Argopecten irradians TaxID=31199 RepID=UPI0037175990